MKRYLVERPSGKVIVRTVEAMLAQQGGNEDRPPPNDIYRRTGGAVRCVVSSQSPQPSVLFGAYSSAIRTVRGERHEVGWVCLCGVEL